jgi:hypothetical protein
MQWLRARTIGVLAAMLLAAGCGSRAREYTPAPQTARLSLEAALNAWSKGEPPGTVEGTPKIQVVDTTRLREQTLESFAVLSETSLAAKGRCYVVSLKLANPPADMRARYVVVGIDPIWIFRKEDYDKLAHWEHPMEATEPSTEDADTTATTITSDERS